MTCANRIGAALLALTLSACASGPPEYDGPPRAQNDICAIFAERPDWRDATQASALRWGVPVELQMAIMWKESNFRARVRPPKTYAGGVIAAGYASSAYGYAQAIDGTWDWYRQDTGNRSADRTEFDDAADFVGWYVNKTVRMNGISIYDSFNQYLNYHEGHTGFRSGRWRSKDWLIGAARKVELQAALYRSQLPTCREY